MRDFEFIYGYFGARDELHATPEAARCIEAMEADERIARHLGALVGSASGLSRIEAEDIFGSVLLPAIHEGTRSWDEERFELAYAATEEWLYADELDRVLVAPLTGIESLEVVPIELRDDLAIDAMSDREIGLALSTGLLHPLPDISVTIVTDKWAVRHQSHVPKVISRLDGLENLAPPAGANPLLIPEEVIHAMRLFKQGRVAVLGALSYQDSLLGSSSTWVGSGSPPRYHAGPYALTAAEAEELVNLWRDINSAAPQSAALANAIRRFGFASDRLLQEDRLVDLMIAAESLLLEPGIKDELRFRTSLHAAWFIQYPGLTPVQVLKQVRRAYDARSDVVHGGAPRPSTLRSPADEAMTLPEFVTLTEDIIRLGIKRAVQEGREGRFPPEWDAVILPSAP